MGDSFAGRVDLEGSAPGFAEIAALAAGAPVRLSEAGLKRAAEGHAAVEAAVARGEPVYGVTTGVGAMKDHFWSGEEIGDFSAGLARAHAFGIGGVLPAPRVRLGIALRINTILGGAAGCSPDLPQALADLLNADLIPVVRSLGSVGCADIGIMGQIAAALGGSGEVFLRGRRLSAAEGFAAAGLKPLRLGPRDALAAISTNALTFAGGLLALREAAQILRLAAVAVLLEAQALGVSRAPWRAALAVGSPEEARIAAWLLEAAGPRGWPQGAQVQDPLSLRMTAQILGAAQGAVLNAAGTLLAAAARPDDNPAVSGGLSLTSGGSLPLDSALALQNLQLALTHLARNLFNRMAVAISGGRRGLPTNLAGRGAPATGFGPALKLAGDLAVRSLTLAQPVSASSLVMAAGAEDEAAFLPLIVERLEGQISALRFLIALNAVFAAQALDLLAETPSEPQSPQAELYALVRRFSPPMFEDRPLSAELEALEADLFSDPAAARIFALRPSPLDAAFALTSPFCAKEFAS